jgi:membrane protease YdiL (CAAX protease family)
VLPYQPRKPVPWQGAHLVALAATYIALQLVLVLLLRVWLGSGLTEPPPPDQQRLSSEHVVAQALEQGGASMLILCAVAVVVVAPIVEEFLFRVLLQGWLEARERGWRRRMAAIRSLSRGLLPVLLSSLLFAAVHYRGQKPQLQAEYLFWLLLANAAANVLTLLVAIGLLRFTARATTADLGWDPRYFWSDVRWGLLAFLAAAPPVYMLQIVLQQYVVPGTVAADPIPLLLFAVVLGTLYFRSHRIVPSITAHAALNAASLAMAWLAGANG